MGEIPYLGTAIVSMTLALTFYSVGTWGEHLQHRLKLWHICFFCLGLTADSFGTAVMGQIAGDSMDRLHAVTGAVALVLMFIHAAWAIYTYWWGCERAKKNFSKFSVFVWTFWLIPYIGGVFLGMNG